MEYTGPVVVIVFDGSFDGVYYSLGKHMYSIHRFLPAHNCIVSIDAIYMYMYTHGIQKCFLVLC